MESDEKMIVAAEDGDESGNGGPAKVLLAWYDHHGRALPWRAPPGARPDPYRVWLSEIMLQQTTVAAVKPYFRAFLARWPTVRDLARAPLEDVLHAWQGLGYYARARNLHACARAVAEEHGGTFPEDEVTLRTLPGIGRYTAAAIAAIAFGRRTVVVDGNVERVMARLHRVETPLPRAKDRLAALADALTPDTRCGDYAQAVMDLGATVCTPRAPQCLVCPWRSRCAGAEAGDPERFPLRAPKVERPTRRGVAFWAMSGDGSVLLRRRPPRGLLGGMMEVPSSGWREGPADPDLALSEAPLEADWQALPGVVRHTFTHFHLELTVLAARMHDPPEAAGTWWPLDRLGEQALPTVMKKVVRHALRHAA